MAKGSKTTASINSGFPPEFDPVLVKWFRKHYPEPTEIQQRAWPLIAQGEHLLVTAPTGSGKTLTAFFWALNQLLCGNWETGKTSVLYVSPLKALNNDIQRNLLTPLSSIQKHLETLQINCPRIKVQTRSGDTPADERQRMIRKPPDILITTPESLALLLASRRAANTLNQIKTVILDEIHAVVDSKRGVYLMGAIEQLAHRAGEFQRIALSATVSPLETVAAFVGGYQQTGTWETPRFSQRSVRIVKSTIKKEYALSTCFPDEAVEAAPEESIWPPVAKECKRRIANNRSTLIFTNNRTLCEKLTLLINAGEPDLVAYAHHGSLSREIRLDVENRLKQGQLKAIVATSSLELGIDIGDLDEVILVGCPGSVSSTIQRLGRAGHRIGQISHGCLITTHSRDFIESASLLEAIQTRNIEASSPIRTPLDLLPQLLVAMVATGDWTRESSYHAIRSCHVYHDLNEQHFDTVLNMMLGRFAESRIPDLRPLFGIDTKSGILNLRQGALHRFYLNAGVIPNRGYYHLRHSESQARIGELDEEYVWEATVGQALTLGTQHWKIDRISHNDVFVSAANPKAPGIPFWRAEDLNRSPEFSDQIATFLETANAELEKKSFPSLLQKKYHLDKNTASALADHLKSQQNHTRRDLPHRHHLLIESTTTGPGAVPGNQIVLHTLWGGKLNQPYAMALKQACSDRFDQTIEIHPSNDCVAMVLPAEIEAETLIDLVTSENIESLLRSHLEHSGFFAARFRECAGRALLISKRKFNERLPLWMSRLRSQKLFDAVSKHPNFPITLETWRTCLHDEFNLPHLRTKLQELESGTITWSEAKTHQPSPMARAVAWRQVNEYMYRPDAAPGGSKKPSLAQNLVQELLAQDLLRPRIPTSIIENFEAKRQRLAPGYTPDTATELAEWLKERTALPRAEWDALLEGIERDHPLSREELLSSLQDQVLATGGSQQTTKLFLHIQNRNLLTEDKPVFHLDHELNWTPLTTSTEPLEHPAQPDDQSREQLVLDWLRYCGPVTVETLSSTLGLTVTSIESFLSTGIDTGQITSGELREDSAQIHYCDKDNLEFLLRLKRRAEQPSVEPLPASYLQWFLASHQGLTNKDMDPASSIIERINQLLFYRLPCGLIETEILPSRISNYTTRALDLELQETPMIWIGTEKDHVQFAHAEEFHLKPGSTPDPSHDPNAKTLLPDPSAEYTLNQLTELTQTPASTLSERIWQEVWEGRISNDRFTTLRQGILNQFNAAALTAPAAFGAPRRQRLSSRASGTSLSKWRGSQGSQGHWFTLPQTTETPDTIEKEEIKKDRVRILLDRYGVLFRELLRREQDGFTWSDLFRTLRLMEFSGEIVSGYFFEGIPGPQFSTQRLIRKLKTSLGKSDVYWLNAADPISLSGIEVPALRPGFPKRLRGNHIVFHQDQLILTSERYAKKLTIKVPPEAECLSQAFQFMRHLLTRSFQPLDRIMIEKINENNATSSPYLELLRAHFDVIVEVGKVSIYRPID